MPTATPVAAPPARRDARPAALSPAFRLGADPIPPPGLAPAHNHRSQYKDGAGIIKVTKIADERAQGALIDTNTGTPDSSSRGLAPGSPAG
jgi:hypothetical protein